MDDIITGLVGPDALLNMDGPAHREMRNRIMEVFSRRNAAEIVRSGGADLLAEMRCALLAGKTVDVVRYSQRLVGRSITRAIGVQVTGEKTYGEVASIASSITSMLGLDKLKPTEEDIRRASVHYRKLLALARGGYGQGREGEASTVMSKLQAAGLSFEQASGVLAVVLLAGTETVSVALPRIVAMLVDSGQIALLSARRELLPNTVVEGLRVVVPSHVILRSVGEDVVLGDMNFKKGRRVLVLLYNALKSPERFPEPRRFDIEREVEPRFKHLCFGAGSHFCLGFALAQAEISTFVEALLDLPGTLRVVGRKYPRDMNFPSYRSLRVRLEPPGSAP
jgi:cytochrome P450